MNRFANLLIQSLVFLVFVIMGAKMAVQGSVSIGDLAVLLICLNMIFTQFSALLGGYSRFLDAGEALKTLKDVSNGMAVAEEWVGRHPMPSAGSFSFHDVAFAHPGRDILKGIQFAIAPGESVALVGKNGSGKTTLIHILMGLIRPHSGSVRYGNIDLADIDISQYRSAIGFVPQNPRLLPGSVRDNLTYGREGVTEGEIQEALRLSMATEVVERLDKGLDTILGEEGARLSGGERQRLAIASAMLGHPRILIMDEPTNHLDSSAIKQFVSNIRQLPQTPTILFASHEREMLGMADRVFVLEDGRLTEASPVESYSNGTLVGMPD
jgi:ABC-type bacteriocin/lantibiotic exporter with double-glycine peptidase domain